MKIFFLLFFLYFLYFLYGAPVFSNELNDDPVCHSYGAKTIEARVIGDSSEAIILCQFGISSLLDKGSVRNSVGGFGTVAVRSYRESGQGPVGRHCSSFGATLSRAEDERGQVYFLCKFFDGSWMEERTFMMGPQSGFNREMDSALGIGI
jgi:hypothetical protein